MIILEDIPLEERKKYLEDLERKNEEKKSFISKLQNIPSKYEIIQNNQLVILGKTLTQTFTRTEWEVSYTENSRIEVEIIVLDEEEKSDNQWRELFQLMKKLTMPLRKIKFELSPEGSILNILNKEEIRLKWEEVKSEFINDKSFSQVIQLGDADYSNPIQAIRKNIVYQLFFFCFHKKINELNKTIIIGKNIPLQSIIFPECSFNVDIEEKAYQINNKLIHFNQYTTGKINGNPIKTLYKEKYKQFMLQNAGHDEGVDNYSIAYQCDYRVFVEIGILNYCKALFEEKVNKDLYYKTDIEIKLKDQYNDSTICS